MVVSCFNFGEDEIIHFKDWNPWIEIRGAPPLISLPREIEQDQRANSATTKLLRNNAAFKSHPIFAVIDYATP